MDRTLVILPFRTIIGQVITRVLYVHILRELNSSQWPRRYGMIILRPVCERSGISKVGTRAAQWSYAYSQFKTIMGNNTIG